MWRRVRWTISGIGVWLLVLCGPELRALDLKVGAQPLQHALVKQLFSAADGRYYLRGNRTSACYLYAQNPQLHFGGDRIYLDLHLSGKLGGSFAGECLGFSWAGDAEVSMLPQAQGSMIGFTDVQVDRLTSDHTLDRMLQPLLAQLVPRAIKVDAASLVSKMLHAASTRSGQTIELQQLQIERMQVEGDALELTLDGGVTIF
jgi:hypothetical protein